MHWIDPREWTPEPLITVLIAYIDFSEPSCSKEKSVFLTSGCINDEGDWFADHDILTNETWDKKLDVIAWTFAPKIVNKNLQSDCDIYDN